jgi:hypothetical protein
MSSPQTDPQGGGGSGGDARNDADDKGRVALLASSVPLGQALHPHQLDLEFASLCYHIVPL